MKLLRRQWLGWTGCTASSASVPAVQLLPTELAPQTELGFRVAEAAVLSAWEEAALLDLVEVQRQELRPGRRRNSRLQPYSRQVAVPPLAKPVRLPMSAAPVDRPEAAPRQRELLQPPHRRRNSQQQACSRQTVRLAGRVLPLAVRQRLRRPPSREVRLAILHSAVGLLRPFEGMSRTRSASARALAN